MCKNCTGYCLISSVFIDLFFALMKHNLTANAETDLMIRVGHRKKKEESF